MPNPDAHADASEGTGVSATPDVLDGDAATVEEVAARPLSDASPTAATTAVDPPRRRSPFGLFRRTAGGVGAVGVKELRGRMRGRRAFVILTLYLVLLAGFAWMVELIMERTYATGFGGNATFATAAIGQGIFVVDPDARDAAGRVPRPDGDGRVDQPRAREADARDARRDADHVGRRSSSASC